MLCDNPTNSDVAKPDDISLALQHEVLDAFLATSPAVGQFQKLNMNPLLIEVFEEWTQVMMVFISSWGYLIPFKTTSTAISWIESVHILCESSTTACHYSLMS